MIKTNKYKNVKVEIDDEKFDSKAEARRYAELKLLASVGVITQLKRQVVYELAPSVIINGRKRPPLRYIADFEYVEHGKLIVADVKGMLTPIYKLKRHLMMSVYGLAILETK